MRNVERLDREAEAERGRPATVVAGRDAPGLVEQLQRTAGNRAVARMVAARRTLARFVPTQPEQARVDTALDALLGAGQDPGGLRAALVAAAASIGALEADAAAIVTAVPAVALRRELLVDVRDLTITNALLVACVHPQGLGAPGPRLKRVLEVSPAARTLAGLQAEITQALAFEEKVLRGRPGTLPPGASAAGAAGVLIGGHSSAILADPGFDVVLPLNPLAPNATQVAAFYKLLRNDGGAAASAVANNAGGTVVDAAVALSARALAVVNLIPAAVLPGNHATLPAQAQTFHTNRVGKDTAARTAVTNGDNAVQTAAAQVRLDAAQAAAQPANAGLVRRFTEGVTDLVAQARSVASSAKDVAKNVATQLQGHAAALDAALLAFDQFGPAMSDKKTSTLAPAAWTDEAILVAGAETAAEAPLLMDQPAHPNNGALVRTKHQKVINGVLWVAIKQNVVFNAGAPPTFTGGVQTSSWPTTLGAIPPAPAPGNADGDGFYPV